MMHLSASRVAPVGPSHRPYRILFPLMVFWLQPIGATHRATSETGLAAQALWGAAGSEKDTKRMCSGASAGRQEDTACASVESSPRHGSVAPGTLPAGKTPSFVFSEEPRVRGRGQWAAGLSMPVGNWPLPFVLPSRV